MTPEESCCRSPHLHYGTAWGMPWFPVAVCCRCNVTLSRMSWLVDPIFYGCEWFAQNLLNATSLPVRFKGSVDHMKDDI